MSPNRGIKSFGQIFIVLGVLKEAVDRAEVLRSPAPGTLKI